MKRHELGLVFSDYAARPSGLIVPVDLATQPAPLVLPPGVKAPRRPTPVFIQRDAPAPIDSIHSWIDERQLGIRATTLADLIDGIKLMPFELSFRALAYLLRRLTVISRDAGAQLELARRVYVGLPWVLPRMQEILAREPGRVVFAEPILVPLLRLLIEHAHDGAATAADDALELLFEAILLGAPSGIGEGAEADVGMHETARWLAFFMRKSNFLRNRATLNGLVRQHLLFDLMRGPLDERAEAERCEVDQAMKEMFGLAIDEQLRLGFGLAAHLHLWDDEGDEINLMRFPPGAFDRFLEGLRLSHIADSATALISRTRDEFRREFERLDADRSLLTSMYVPFQQTPFLRLPDGSLILTSPRFVSDWLEDGFHYRALDAVAGRPPDRSRSARYLRFAGHVFERYCVELAKTVHRVAFAGHIKVLGDFAYRSRDGERRTVDLMIFSSTELVLFEIEHHRPGFPVAVRGDVVASEKDLRDHVVDTVGNLAEFIELLRSGRPPTIPGLDMRTIHRVWPVIVGVEVPAQMPPLWQLLDEQAIPRLVRTGAEPLTILDAEDFETLCGIVEAGKLLPTLLERKCSPPYHRLELKRWLDDDPLAPSPRRPRPLEEKYEDLMDGVIAAIRPQG